VIAALLAVAAVGAPFGCEGALAGAQSETVEAAPLSDVHVETYVETLDIVRSPDLHVFGFIREGCMMVPVRPTAEAYGAIVHWVPGVGTLVDGHLTRSVIVLGQAYCPARELATILGCWVEWNETSRAVVLTNGVQRVVVSVPAASCDEEPVTCPSPVSLAPAFPRFAVSESDPLPTAGAPDGVPQAGLPVATLTTPVVVITSVASGPVSPTRDGQESDLADPRGLDKRPSAGRIALTFDDGPDAVYTRRILSVLERYGAKATFFLIGSQVARYPSIVREVVAAGHELGNHGYSHSRLTTLPLEAVRREISRTQEAVRSAASVTPRWFRPPYGSYDEEVRRIAKDEGAATVLWTLNPDDWRNPGQAAIVRRVVSAAKDGAIVLLHVREQTANALPALIEELMSRGFEFVPLSGILGATGKRLESPGRPQAPAGPSGDGRAAPATSEGTQGDSGSGASGADGVAPGPPAAYGASEIAP
jgi:peptidoglycan/xylan/chitin deacetylase (PgdA/CDA1 family)